MFDHETSVKLHDTDAAGLLFFGHQFKIAHDTYELFMESIDFTFATLFHVRDFHLAIVHAEADFKNPLYVGDRIKTRLTIDRIGRSSYTLAYSIVDKDGVEVGTAKTVHVCVDKASGKSRDLPEDLRAKLEKSS